MEINESSDKTEINLTRMLKLMPGIASNCKQY